MRNWFVALPVPSDSWAEWLPVVPEGTRGVALDDLHLTLAFLGDVGAARALRAFEAFPKNALACFRCVLGAVVPMGSRRRPSALSVEVSGRDSTDRAIELALVDPRDRILESAGCPAESRAFRPHITLARMRRSASGAERAAALAWAAAIDLESARVDLDRIALYTSARRRSGRAYETVAMHRLPVGESKGP